MKGKIKRFLLILSFIFCLFGTGSAESLLNADTVFADEKDDDYSFYKIADSLSVWFNKELVPDGDKGGKIEIVNFDAGEAGSLVGYTKENLASWITSLVAADSVQYSYNSLKMLHVKAGSDDQKGINNPIYQYAVYGWVLRETGADAYVNSFFMHPIHWITGGFLVIPYILVSLIPLLFSKIIDFLQMINPFGLIGRSEYFQKFLGSTISVGSNEYGVKDGFYTNGLTAQFARWYNTLTNIGLYIAIPGFIIAAVAMYFVFKKTQGDKSHFKKIILRIASILITVPLMGMFYTSILNDLGDKFNVSNPGDTVLSKTVVDFGQWAKETRLAFPDGNTAGGDPSVGTDGNFNLVVSVDSNNKLRLEDANFSKDYSRSSEDKRENQKSVLSLPEFAYVINRDLGNTPNGFTGTGTRTYSSDVVRDAMFSYADINQTTGEITVHTNTSGGVDGTNGELFSWLPSLMGYWSADTINANDLETEYKGILSSYVARKGNVDGSGDEKKLKKTLTDMTKHFNADGSEANMKEESDKNIFFSYGLSDISSEAHSWWAPAYLTASSTEGGIVVDKGQANSGKLVYKIKTDTTAGRINELHNAYKDIMTNESSPNGANMVSYSKYLSSGGLTPVSMYNYLASEFKADSVTIYSTRDASSGMVKRPHTSVNIIGRNGFEKFVYGFGACITMIALTVLGLFYGFAILFSSIKNGIQLIVQTPFVLLGSITAAFRVASLTIMMILEVVVTIVMYEVAAELMTNVYNLFTGVENQNANMFLVLLGAIAVCVLTALLVKYRRVAVKAIEGVIDSIMQKIANLFGSSYQGTGSAAGSQSGVGAGIAGLAGAAAGTALAGRMAGHGSGQGSSGKNGDTITGKAKGGSDDGGGNDTPGSGPEGTSTVGEDKQLPSVKDGNEDTSGTSLIDGGNQNNTEETPVDGGTPAVKDGDGSGGETPETPDGTPEGDGVAGGQVESDSEKTGGQNIQDTTDDSISGKKPNGSTGTSTTGVQNKPDDKTDEKGKSEEHDNSAKGVGVFEKEGKGNSPDGKALTDKKGTNAKPVNPNEKDKKQGDGGSKTQKKDVGKTGTNPNGSVDTNKGNGAENKRKGILGGIFGRAGRNKTGESTNSEGKKKGGKGTTNGTNGTGVKTRGGTPPKKINLTAPRTGTNTNGKEVSSKQGNTTKPTTPKPDKKKNPISRGIGKVNTTMGKGIKAYGKALGVEAAATMLDKATGGHGGSAIRFSYLNGLQNKNTQGQNTVNANTNEVKGGNNMSSQDNISSRLGYKPMGNGQVNTNSQNVQNAPVNNTVGGASNNTPVSRNVNAASTQSFVFNPDTGNIQRQRQTHIPPNDTGAGIIGEDKVIPKVAPKNNKDK